MLYDIRNKSCEFSHRLLEFLKQEKYLPDSLEVSFDFLYWTTFPIIQLFQKNEWIIFAGHWSKDLNSDILFYIF